MSSNVLNDEDSMQFALSIDLIREKILDNLVWHNQKIPDPSNPGKFLKRINKEAMAALRLVCKDWLDETTHLVRSGGEPYFCVYDDQNQWAGDEVPYFVSLVSRPGSVYPRMDTTGRREIPTFGMKISSMFFDRENWDDLDTCLVELGSGLVEIKFQFPINASMRIDFDNFVLPRLRRITVDISEVMLEGDPPLNPQEFERNGEPVPTKNFQEFLQTLLNASRVLTHVTFYDSDRKEFFYFPATFRSLRLPNSVSRIEFKSPLSRPQDLLMLLAPQNTLCNLTMLTLHAFDRPFDRNGIHNLLKKVSGSLTHLKLEGVRWGGVTSMAATLASTTIVFPRMMRLKSLQIVSSRWTINPGVTHMMTRFPVLQDICYTCTETEFQNRWLNNAVYCTVQSLGLCLTGVEDEDDQGQQDGDAQGDGDGGDESDESDEEDDGDGNNAGNGQNAPNAGPAIQLVFDDADARTPRVWAPISSLPFPLLPLTPQRVQLAVRGFPNICKLQLTILGSSETSGWKAIFKEMKNLTCLSLAVAENPQSRVPIPATFYDSVFTGLPASEVQSILALDEKKMAEKVYTFFNGESTAETPTVRDLAKLNQLHLACPGRPSRNGQGYTVFTHVSFYFAFLRMPALKHLGLVGGFLPTQEVKRLWKNSGDERSLSYNRTH